MRADTNIENAEQEKYMTGCISMRSIGKEAAKKAEAACPIGHAVSAFLCRSFHRLQKLCKALQPGSGLLVAGI